MPACLFVQHLRAEKDIRYPETGVTGSCCESPRSVLGMEPRSSTRAANTELSLQDHVLIFFFKCYFGPIDIKFKEQLMNAVHSE